MASVGPAPPPSPQHKRKRGGDSHESNPSPSSRQSGLPGVDEYKKRRVLGPSLPPAPLDQMPAASPNKTPAAPQDESSSDESDFGPAPGPPVESSGTGPIFPHRVDQTEEHERVSSKPQREEWMLAPPTHGDWTSRVDPTKLRNRKFNTGKGARAPNQSRSADNRLWTETPEQKRQRLEDEVLGKKKVAQTDDRPPNPSRNEAEDRETERRIREYNVRLALSGRGRRG